MTLSISLCTSNLSLASVMWRSCRAMFSTNSPTSSWLRWGSGGVWSPSFLAVWVRRWSRVSATPASAPRRLSEELLLHLRRLSHTFPGVTLLISPCAAPADDVVLFPLLLLWRLWRTVPTISSSVESSPSDNPS